MWRVQSTLAVALVCGWAAPLLAHDRALVVGIEKYASSSVPNAVGAEADAQALDSLLIEEFHFAPEEIKVLVGPAATREAILASFDAWLIGGSSPGDRVFFSYAGHGSQLADDDGDEDDGKDETLAAYDVDPTGSAGQIRDDELSMLVGALSGRRAVLLFDSCHSGTVTRGASSSSPGHPRFLPEAGGMREALGTRGAWGIAPGSASGDSKVLDMAKLGSRTPGLVILSAAGPGQLAYPLKTDAGYRGALTYAFESVYRSVPPSGPGGVSRGLWEAVKTNVAQGVGMVSTAALGSKAQQLAGSGAAGNLAQAVTVESAGTAITAGIASMQDSGQLDGNQEPWFEVVGQRPLREEPLFGDGWAAEASASMANPLSPSTVSVRTVDGRSVYRRDEIVRLAVESSSDGYLYLLVMSEGRRATCVFPSEGDLDNRVKAGTTVFPRTAREEFPVQEPFGRDVVVALVADAPLGLCDRPGAAYSWDDVFRITDLTGVLDELRDNATRGIGVRKVQPAGAPAGSKVRTPWQAGSFVLQTAAN